MYLKNHTFQKHHVQIRSDTSPARSETSGQCKFQGPKMEVLSYTRLYFVGIFSDKKNRPYIKMVGTPQIDRFLKWPLRTAILAGFMNVVIWLYFFYKISVELPAVIGEIPQAELPGLWWWCGLKKTWWSIVHPPEMGKLRLRFCFFFHDFIWWPAAKRNHATPRLDARVLQNQTFLTVDTMSEIIDPMLLNFRINEVFILAREIYDFHAILRGFFFGYFFILMMKFFKTFQAGVVFCFRFFWVSESLEFCVMRNNSWIGLTD